MSHTTQKPNEIFVADAYRRPMGRGITFTDPSRTKQEFADEADINILMSKYAQTGLLGPKGIPLQPPTYRDITHMAGDYHQAMNTVTRAESFFEAAPAAIRDRFQNSPEALLRFLADPANREEGERLGLVEKRPQGGSTPPEPPKTDTPHK